jgi:hypothetical protein
MPLFQSTELKISSGYNGFFTTTLNKIQNISVNHNIPRQDINVLSKSRPLLQRPVINFTPVNYSVDFYKSDKEIESNLGLLNPTGCAVYLGLSNSMSGFGCRDLELYLIKGDYYANQINISSGYLQSYSINAGVGDFSRGSFNGEGLNCEHLSNQTQKDVLDYSLDLVRPENIKVSGIEFSGFGLSGLNVQSFSINLSFTRQSIFKLGYKYPDRPLTDARAVININGFIDGITPTTGLQSYDCGFPETGTYYLTLKPSCSNTAATTYKIINPYLDSFNFGASVGSFVSTDLSFSIPLPFTPDDASTGSNLIIY